MTAPRRGHLRLLAVALCWVVAAGCGSGDGAADAPPLLVLSDAFTIPGDRTLAVYLTIANDGGPDQIVGAQLVGEDEGRAEGITLHRAVERDGLTVMGPAKRIDLPAHSRTALDPGRGHLMLEGLRSPVTSADRLHVELHFKRSAPQAIEVEVVTADEALRRSAPAQPAAG